MFESIFGIIIILLLLIAPIIFTFKLYSISSHLSSITDKLDTIEDKFPKEEYPLTELFNLGILSVTEVDEMKKQFYSYTQENPQLNSQDFLRYKKYLDTLKAHGCLDDELYREKLNLIREKFI